MIFKLVYSAKRSYESVLLSSSWCLKAMSKEISHRWAKIWLQNESCRPVEQLKIMSISCWPLKCFWCVNQFVGAFLLVGLSTIIPIQIVQSDHECEQNLYIQHCLALAEIRNRPWCIDALQYTNQSNPQNTGIHFSLIPLDCGYSLIPTPPGSGTYKLPKNYCLE